MASSFGLHTFSFGFLLLFHLRFGPALLLPIMTSSAQQVDYCGAFSHHSSVCSGKHTVQLKRTTQSLLRLLRGVINPSRIQIGFATQVQDLLLLHRLVQHTQEIIVGVKHGEHSGLLQLLEEPLSEGGSIRHSVPIRQRRVRNVHAVPIHKNGVAVAHITQVLEPLHLVIRVVDERLVEER